MSEPIKYPSLIPVYNIVRGKYKVYEKNKHKRIYIEPKYDGSNITCFNGSCYTRSLLPLSPRFNGGLIEALDDSYGSLMELSRSYQVFLELGGKANNPAGYDRCWNGEWEYVIFDLYSPSESRFLGPEEANGIVSSYGLRFINFKVGVFEDVIENHVSILKDYSIYEGFVVKYYSSKPIGLTGFYNLFGVKVKHEYVIEGGVKKSKQKSSRHDSFNINVLEDSEIFGVINKVHMEIGNKIRNKRVAMPIIARRIREEAKKHGRVPPNPSKLFSMYRLYIERLDSHS